MCSYSRTHPSHHMMRNTTHKPASEPNSTKIDSLYFILYVHYRKLIQIIQGHLGASRLEHVARDAQHKALSNNHGIAKRPTANKKLNKSRDKPLEDDGGAVGKEAVMMAGLGA